MNDAFGQPQVAVVLGGTSDIAGAVVDRLAAARCRTVVLAGRDGADLQRAAERARAAGAGQVATVAFDATGPDPAAAATVDACLAAAGQPVDLVLVAVGALGDESGDHHDPVEVARLATVNFAWPAAALAAAAGRLRQQGTGRLVVLSSVAAVRTRPSNLAYGAAKAGVDAFALGLRQDLRGSGVTVQVVRPGFVATKMTEGRPAAPFATTAEAVADAVVAALGGDRAVVWVPPAVRGVFAVARLLPLRLWWRVAGRS